MPLEAVLVQACDRGLLALAINQLSSRRRVMDSMIRARVRLAGLPTVPGTILDGADAVMLSARPRWVLSRSKHRTMAAIISRRRTVESTRVDPGFYATELALSVKRRRVSPSTWMPRVYLVTFSQSLLRLACCRACAVRSRYWPSRRSSHDAPPPVVGYPDIPRVPGWTPATWSLGSGRSVTPGGHRRSARHRRRHAPGHRRLLRTCCVSMKSEMKPVCIGGTRHA